MGIRLVGYEAPGKADEYKDNAFEWTANRPPERKLKRLDRWRFGKEIRTIQSGKFYCNAVVGVQDKKIEHEDGGHHYLWKYVAMPCAEIENGAMG